MTIHRLLRTRLLTPKKEPFVLKMTTRRQPQYSTDEQPLPFLQRNYSSTRWQENRLLLYLKKWFKTADDKLHKKGNQPTDRQIKGKRTIHQNVKSTQKDSHPHKNREDITTTVQASGAGSKLLITLSAMGFISATYSENFSSEQPTATPSPIGDKFAEGRKGFN